MGPLKTTTAFLVLFGVLNGLDAMPQNSGYGDDTAYMNRPLFEGFTDSIRGQKAIRVVFYNIENLYDTHNDSLTNDDEFTPEGAKHWSFGRYLKKINALSKTILAAGGWEPPEIVGLCEVENRNVLNKLIHESALSGTGYRIIHHDSPDPRGVDVALLYRPHKVYLISDAVIPVIFAPETEAHTRDILYAKLIILNTDTLHLFVNHWPSRFGGYMQTVGKRSVAASILRQKADSIFQKDPVANILIMGDLNDDPADESIAVVLKAVSRSSPPLPGRLVNLMQGHAFSGYSGTLKHGESWHTFDQFIVSGALFDGVNKLRVGPDPNLIFRAPFLLMDDQNRFGDKLNRTYLGPRYLGGFSDHLPIYLDVYLNE